MTLYDYITGTSFIAATILVVFVLWLALLCVFKFLGKKVGFLSGRRLKGEKPHWFVRTTVMVSSAFALAAGAMYLMKATTSLYDTFDSIRAGADVSKNFSALLQWKEVGLFTGVLAFLTYSIHRVSRTLQRISQI